MIMTTFATTMLETKTTMTTMIMMTIAHLAGSAQDEVVHDEIEVAVQATANATAVTTMTVTMMKSQPSEPSSRLGKRRSLA
jgi:hypothetical protein